MEQATVPLVKGKVTTEDLNEVRKASERDCECTDAQRLAPEMGVYCKPCAARSILNGIISLVKRL
jgi:hypothetical protein